MEADSIDTITAAVFAGGTITTTTVVASSLVIAADSGYDNARSLGVAVDVLVGDMDSISVENLAKAAALGVTIERFPTDKDATDLEIAIDAAIARGATRITVYGGEGGSFSHLLGNALGLTADRWADVHIVWKLGDATVHRALPSSPVTIGTTIGTIVTVLPIGDASGVTATGLRWALTDSDLARGTSRGLSNVVSDPPVSISVDSGALLIIVEQSRTT